MWINAERGAECCKLAARALGCAGAYPTADDPCVPAGGPMHATCASLLADERVSGEGSEFECDAFPIPGNTYHLVLSALLLFAVTLPVDRILQFMVEYSNSADVPDLWRSPPIFHRARRALRRLLPGPAPADLAFLDCTFLDEEGAGAGGEEFEEDAGGGSESNASSPPISRIGSLLGGGGSGSMRSLLGGGLARKHTLPGGLDAGGGIARGDSATSPLGGEMQSDSAMNTPRGEIAADATADSAASTPLAPVRTPGESSARGRGLGKGSLRAGRGRKSLASSGDASLFEVEKAYAPQITPPRALRFFSRRLMSSAGAQA